MSSVWTVKLPVNFLQGAFTFVTRMYTKTSFPPFESLLQMQHGDLIYSCGSCFASELADRLEALQFQVIRHPFGIVYNPLSISLQFQKLLLKIPYTESALQFQDGLYHCMDHHGSYSMPDKTQLLDQLNANAGEAYNALKHCQFLVITLGSSYFFRLKSNQQVVANCHKIPSDQFTKELASYEEILTNLSQTIVKLNAFNPSLKILLSVSPVRYLKDGFIQNQRSKSRLLLACEQLCNQFEFCEYIPTYEIFMDDLRDYRYVKEDLVHPNSIAVDYLFNYFEQAYFKPATRVLVEKIRRWNQLSGHRVLHAASDAYTKYQKNLEQLYVEIKNEWPKFKRD